MKRFSLFSLCGLMLLSGSVYAQSPENQTSSDPFENGNVPAAIESVAKLPKNYQSCAAIVAGLQKLSPDVDITLSQVLTFFKIAATATNANMKPEDEDVFLIYFKRVMNSESDQAEVAKAFKAGMGVYGGPRDQGNVARFFKRGQLLDLQILFLPNFEATLKTKDYAHAFQTLQACYDRALLSGREKDARIAWNYLAMYMKTPDYAIKSKHSSTPNSFFVGLLPLLPRETTEPLVDAVFMKETQPSVMDGANLNIYRSLYNAVQQKTSRAAPVGVVDKLWWRNDFNTLKWVTEKLAPKYISRAPWRAHFSNQIQLWVKATRRLLNDNDARMRNARYAYNRQKNGHDFLTKADARELLDMGPTSEILLNAFKTQSGASTSLLSDIYIDLSILMDNYEEAVDLILKNTQNPVTRSQQCDRLLQKMSASLNPNATPAQPNPNYIGMPSGADRVQNAIAITRLRQKENIRQFRSVITRMEKAGVSVSFERRLACFDAMHSAAEVYAYDDMVMAFGEPEKLSFNSAMLLVNHLRKKLEGWSKEEVQAAAQTRRSPKETEDLTSSAYDLVDRFISEVEKGEAGRNPILFAIHGVVLYENANYLESKKAPETYVERKRTEGLQKFQRAGDIYAASVPFLYESQYSVQLYELWLDAFLVVGTGKTAVKDRPNVEAIRTSILKMPADAAQKHLELFANRMYVKMSSQGPYTRRSYIVTALRVTAGTRMEQRFKERLEYYDNLLNEAKLQVTVDANDGKVSPTQFGVRVRLLYTPELSRESGGFARYLQPSENPTHALAMSFSGVPTAASIAGREMVEKRLRESLEESFDILSIAFADPKSQPKTEAGGYQSIPVAYFLLRPKDVTVDQVPAMAFDLEFADHGDVVYLPTVSAPVPVAFGEETNRLVPPKNLEIAQRLNLRDLERGEGRATLEVIATAESLIGPWDTLFADSSHKGFTIADMEDGGAQIKEYTSENGDMLMTFERIWVFHLKPENKKQIPLTFEFTNTLASAKMRYLFTRDVNFKPTQAVCSIRDAEGFSESVDVFVNRHQGFMNWIYALLGTLLLGGILYGVWRAFRCRPTTSGTIVSVPKKLTPFTVLHYLRTLESDPSILTTAERDQIRVDIAAIERDWFAPSAETNSLENRLDCAQIFEKWRRSV